MAGHMSEIQVAAEAGRPPLSRWGSRGGAEISWHGSRTWTRQRRVALGERLPQAGVVALKLGRLEGQAPFGRAQLSAANASGPPHAHRPDHQQANHEPNAATMADNWPSL
jgi:hypothetical protein